MKPASVERVFFQSFRGFAERVTLPMMNGRRRMSVLIWGDNGTGKSSFADGVEFFFSPKGTVERLGEKTTENRAGTVSLRHVTSTLRTTVAFEFGGNRTVERHVIGAAAQKIPAETRALMESVPAPLVLRAAEMRSFVADNTGADRYALLAKWIGLDRLTGLLDDLTKAQGKIAKLNRSEAKLEKQKDLTRLTQGALVVWDTPSVLAWVNRSLLADLPAELGVSGPRDLRELESKLSERSTASATGTGSTAYADALTSLSVLGDIYARCEQPARQWRAAADDLEKVRKIHAASSIRDVALAARDYIASTDLSMCPVCRRPFDAAVTRESVLSQLDETLETLREISTREEDAGTACKELKKEVRGLHLAVSEASRRLAALPEANTLSVSGDVGNLLDAVARWHDAADRGGHPSFDEIARSFSAMQRPIEQTSAILGRRRDELAKESVTPWAHLVATVNQLREIGNRWVEIQRDEAAITLAAEQFKQVAERIRADVAQHVQSIVAELASDVRGIYASLRRNDGYLPDLNIVVASEKKSMTFEMELFGLPKLVPSGYLSDSQLNSLGLALFLAAVRRFNGDFRFLVLDDIMSSYDAGHRLNLIEVIREYLADFHVVMTTHDEPFFKQGRAILNDTGSWMFYRLKPWSLDCGVRISGVGTADEEIERRLRDGEEVSVIAGLVRDRVESWAQNLCAKSGARLPVRVRNDGSLEDPTLSDFWQAAQNCLTESHRKHPSYAFVAAHGLLNLPLHNATGNRMTISNGEIETFWNHFKTLRVEV